MGASTDGSFVCDITASWMHHVGGSSDWADATPPQGTGVHKYAAYQGKAPCSKNGYCPGCAHPEGTLICSVRIDPEDCSVDGTRTRTSGASRGGMTNWTLGSILSSIIILFGGIPSIINVYCIISALFFGACAYAQLNDPDPILWIAGYILGGCIFNVFVMIYSGCKDRVKDVPFVSHLALLLHIDMCLAFMNIFAVGNATIILCMISHLAPKIDFALPPKDLAWSVLEFEEGREIAGLLLLLSHVLKLRSYLSEAPSNEKNKQSTGNGYGAYAGTFVMLSAIVGAAYLWHYFQPEMNARYNTEHCAGAFEMSQGDDARSSEL